MRISINKDSLDQLIDQINEAIRGRAEQPGSVFSGSRSYGSEPIIRRGAQGLAGEKPVGSTGGPKREKTVGAAPTTGHGRAGGPAGDPGRTRAGQQSGDHGRTRAVRPAPAPGGPREQAAGTRGPSGRPASATRRTPSQTSIFGALPNLDDELADALGSALDAAADSWLLQAATAVPEALTTPEPILRMRRLARTQEARSWTDARLFVEQGRLMADYTDDLPYAGTFASYYPTYDAMNNRQLRGYFSWRTQVRQGKVEETSTSFAYVYLYELLNGIGAEPGLDAFIKIRDFWQSYRAFEPGLDRHVRTWLVDYVVYHGLDHALALPYLGLERTRAIRVAQAAEARALAERPARGRRVPHDFGGRAESDARLFDALAELSTYNIKNSRLYKDAPDDLVAVTCAVFDRLATYYHSSRKQGLTATFFGEQSEMPYLMFSTAVFWPGERHADCTAELDPSCVYRCRSGLWTRDSFHGGTAKSPKMGEVLRAVDRLLREALGYPHPLKEHGEPKYLVGMVEREVADYLAWKKAHAPHEVAIDLSKLAGIRSAAAETCESLLVDEEREDTPVSDAGFEVQAATPEIPAPAAQPDPQAGVQHTEPTVAPAPQAGSIPAAAEPGPSAGPNPAAATSAPAADAPDLTPDEQGLIRRLLNGDAPAAGSVDLMVDSINEKFFDLVGDTVVEFGPDGTPQLIEDYVDDVRAALGA